ncbi:MAG: hypothetical protein JO254_11590 [Pseudolabrys sp.]|nr:hypothetical protein [Pseudolabrys sp.]
MSGIVFSSVPQGHHDAIRLALDAACLPTDDLDASDLMLFRLSDDRGLIGFIGLEGDGTDRNAALARRAAEPSGRWIRQDAGRAP